MAKYPDRILWIDVETSGLDKDLDEILEIGAVLTDPKLEELASYEAALTLTPQAVAQITKDKFIQNMHLDNGLLKACKNSTTTLRQAELALIDLLIANDCSPESVMLAGSGVARFDFDMLQNNMPELASWLAYFVLDVGIIRRAAHMATGGRPIFPKIAESFQEGAKAHRALADVRAHLEEARGQFNVLQTIAEINSIDTPVS